MNDAGHIAGLGTRADHVALAPNVDTARLPLSDDERGVLARIAPAAQIGEVLRRSGLPEAKTIALLLSLRAKGAIVPARVGRAEVAAELLDAAMAEEVDLASERKKEILDLERSLERLDHFAALGLPPGALPEQVKKAYYEASRRYHPDRYFGKSLGSFRARIEKIFKRLSEAHTVLTQPERREAYLKAHPHLAAPAAPAASELGAERQEERRARLARHPYLLRSRRVQELVARGRTALKEGEFELAYRSLQQALEMEPKSREISQLLSEARTLHDGHRATRELRRGEELERQGDMAGAQAAYRLASSLDPQNAQAHFHAARAGRALGQGLNELRTLAQRAVDLEPGRATHHHLLGQLLLELGAKKLAKRHFEEVLELEPHHPEARAQLKKLRWPF